MMANLPCIGWMYFHLCLLQNSSEALSPTSEVLARYRLLCPGIIINYHNPALRRYLVTLFYSTKIDFKCDQYCHQSA